MSKAKKFDCVEMKHRVQEKIDVETKGMSREERREFLRKKREMGPLAEKWNRLTGKRPKGKRAS